jgi:von Willebrand factor type A domain
LCPYRTTAPEKFATLSEVGAAIAVSLSLCSEVRDAAELPISNISPADLEGKTHGKPVKLLSIAPDPRSHRIVLLLDASASMAKVDSEPSLWELELLFACHFVQLNQTKYRIALLIFAKEVIETMEFSEGNSAVAARLQALAQDREFLKTKVKGTTALRDAILRALQLLDHPTSADALYALTDGGDNTSTHSAREVTDRLAMTSVRLFAILLQQEGSYRMHPPEETEGPYDLSEMARKSGGEILSATVWHGGQPALSAGAAAKLRAEETLARLYGTIAQNYLLELELPTPIPKTEKWELKFSEAARHQWKDAQITFPTNLVGCNVEVASDRR